MKKILKKFWCWLTRHDWSWRDHAECLRQLLKGEGGVDGDGFYCYRCGKRWRDRWGDE